jgi:hypothetical protein
MRRPCAFKQLAALDYMPKEYVAFRKIPLFTLASFITIYAALTLMICVLILSV